jgi:hypothetical protein
LVPRPSEFFRSRGPRTLPPFVPLALVPPPGFGEVPITVLRTLVTQRVDAHEDRARRLRRGRPVVGGRQILRQSVFARPRTRDPHFGLDPRIAGEDPATRIEHLLGLRRFLDAYRHARVLLKAGGPEPAVFPAGTWLLPRQLGVRCAKPS